MPLSICATSHLGSRSEAGHTTHDAHRSVDNFYIDDLRHKRVEGALWRTPAPALAIAAPTGLLGRVSTPSGGAANPPAGRGGTDTDLPAAWTNSSRTTGENHAANDRRRHGPKRTCVGLSAKRID
jgi:hypothetical protein